MRVTVMGSGAVGGTLAKTWSKNAIEVTVGVRDVKAPHATALSRELGGLQVKPLRESIADSDVVVFAIPGTAMPEVASSLGDQIDGRLIIDASNNISAPVRNSMAAITAAAPRARVYRAFNSLPSQTLAEPRIDGRPADLFYCGAQGPDQAVIESLISAAGLHPIYVGGSEWALIVDALGGLSFALGRSRPGTRIAFNLVTA